MQKIEYYIFYFCWQTLKTILRLSRVRILNVLIYNPISYTNLIFFNVSLEPVSLCHLRPNTEVKQLLRGLFLSSKCIGSYVADQPACKMSSVEENKTYLFFLRSHRNTYFTFHRYDLGRAEEPIYPEHFSSSHIIFCYSKPHIINHILLCPIRGRIKTINTLDDLLFSSV